MKKGRETRLLGTRRTSPDRLGAPRSGPTHAGCLLEMREKREGFSDLVAALHLQESSDLDFDLGLQARKRRGGGVCEKTGKCPLRPIEGAGSPDSWGPCGDAHVPSGSWLHLPNPEPQRPACDLTSALSLPGVKVGPDPPLLGSL